MFNLEKLQEFLEDLNCEWEYIIDMDFFIKSISGLDTLTYVSELCTLDYHDFQIIGQSTINKVMVTVGDNKNHSDEFLYFLKKKNQPDDNFDELYVSLYYSNPLYWYVFKSYDNLKEQIENLIDIYNIKDVGDHQHLNKEVYAYMGTNSKLLLNSRAIMSRLIISPFSEGFIWGPKYKDFPINRSIFAKLPLDVQYSKLIKIMVQDYTDDDFEDDENKSNKIPFTFSTRTMFSKSIIKFIDYQGVYIGRFKYRPCIIPNYGIQTLNKELKRSYPYDFPIDLVIAIEYYPFLDYINVLEKMDTNSLCMVITRMIPHDRRDLIIKISDKLKEMILEEHMKKESDLSVIFQLDNFRKHCLNSINQNKSEDKYSTSLKKILKDREKRKEKYLDDYRLHIKKLIYRTIQAECEFP
jgi:hypothetical protein